nr:hypothetical protein CFP56_75080 [Quercus suber]
MSSVLGILNKRLAIRPSLISIHFEMDISVNKGAVFNISTSIIGAGIMALPATMKVLGLGLGIDSVCGYSDKGFVGNAAEIQ